MEKFVSPSNRFIEELSEFVKSVLKTNSGKTIRSKLRKKNRIILIFSYSYPMQLSQ